MIAQTLRLQAEANAALGSAADPATDLRIGIAIAVFFFVILLGWAAFVPLNAGVYAPATVAVSGNRQSVQHQHGGIVSAIHVIEGEKVRAGQLLVEMAVPDLRAAERALTGDYLNLLAQRARLDAESSGASDFAEPGEFTNLNMRDRALAEQASRLQRAQLRATLATLGAQQAVLGQRGRQLNEQRAGYTRQGSSLREQQRILEAELRGLRELEKKGFASTNRVRAFERTREELRGREAAMTAEAARAREGIGEMRMQSLTLSHSNQEKIATDLRDTQAKISEVVPKLILARDQLQRSMVRAPASGQIVGLAVFTIGGVVAPGDTLMEIVPNNRMLVIQAKIDPRDADDVYKGQEAKVRFTSINDRSLPLLSGKVRTISADSFTDEKAGRNFFRAEVEVSPAELKKVHGVLGRGQLRPGLPVEIVLAVRKRTALDYLVEPLTGHFWRSFREQ